MPSADLAFVLLKSMMLLWIYTHGSRMGTWPGSQCCCKAERALRPTTRPLIGLGDAVEERKSEAQGKGRSVLVLVDSRRVNDSYSDCLSWEGTARV